MPATTRVTSAASSLPTSPVAGPSCSALSVTAGCAIQLALLQKSMLTAALHRTPRRTATACAAGIPTRHPQLHRVAFSRAAARGWCQRWLMLPAAARKCCLGLLPRVAMLESCTSPLAVLTRQSSWTAGPLSSATGAGIAQLTRHKRRSAGWSLSSRRPLRQVHEGNGSGSEHA